MDSGRPPAGRVEIVVSTRTLVQILAFGFVVVIAALSIATLLSILIAAVLALGLDPIVAALVRRGWSAASRRSPSSPGVIVAVVVIVVLAVGPVFEEVEEFFRALPGYWDELTQKPGFQDLVNSGRRGRQDPQGARRAGGRAARRGERGGRHRRRARSARCCRGRHVGLPRALPADGAPADHRLAVRLHAAAGRGALAAGARALDPRRVVVARRQRRDLDHRRARSRACRRGCSGCPSRSCSA